MQLKERYRTELETQANIVYLSAVSVAELMIKASIGKLDIRFDPVAIAEQTGFQLLSFSGNDALRLKDLPFHHRDPLDRMLVSQAIANDYTIMTDDAKFALYDCRVMVS